jgi:hypothetical protein
MARIDSLEPKESRAHKLHEPVEATYQVFQVGDQTVLQIDTYGSTNREIAGKTSQSIQFGSSGVAALRAVLASLD